MQEQLSRLDVSLRVEVLLDGLLEQQVAEDGKQAHPLVVGEPSTTG